MYFQILQLIIWPKDIVFPPREVKFQPGKLNIITGASRTGKSAIIPIIDYCLASGDCSIPIDTIRDFANWYGIVVQTDYEQVLIARRVPIGNQISNDFYLLRGNIISIPPTIEDRNENIDGVKNYLNTISGVPYFNLDGEEEKKGYTSRLSFRDLMALVFQSQDIVANQNIFFYKTHAHEHREKLRNWFPYILGAENLNTLKARQRIQVIEKRLLQLRREFDRVKTVSSAWTANLGGHLRVAKEYGLLKDDNLDSADSDTLLNMARQVLKVIPEYSLTEFKDVESANKSISDMEAEEIEISAQIGLVKKRLSDVKKLSNGLTDYESSIRKRIDRLQISKWLEDVASEASNCPACGSTEHPESRAEIRKIATVFDNIENQSKSIAEIPTSFSREEERLNQDLELLINRKKDFELRFDAVIRNDKIVRDEFQRRKTMHLFLGNMQASLATFEKLVDGGELKSEIILLEEEFLGLLKISNKQGVADRVEVATERISQGMLRHLATLDVESKYREVAPRFDIKDLNISVLSNDNHWHYLAQVGSASNWVSFHLALMCALQEYFLSQANSCVPSFVIFDQPSQVYFPKLKRNELEQNVEQKILDEDAEAVRGMFETISSSISAMNGRWQGIILDHADESIYGNIEGIQEVAVWRNGDKLIPEAWYR